MALLEVCCGNPESVDAAVLGGARRIELCADLEADGLTPPTAWIRDAKARYPSLTVHVLVRPRAGDFVYSSEEADVMAGQVEEALEAGADGIVIGALTPDGDVDLPLMERLVSLVESYNLAAELLRSDLCHAANDSHFFPGPARRVSITFHRAFDRCRDPFEALEQIISLGCRRILTSGQQPTAEQGIPLLRQLCRQADGRIIIMPGGGVSEHNVRLIADQTGAAEIHGSASGGKGTTQSETVRKILGLL